MRKRSIQGIVVFVGLLFPTGLVHSQTAARFTPRHLASSPAQSALARATPEDVGLSSERLARIARAIQQNVDDKRIAGGVSLVARHGKVVYLHAVGMADRELKSPCRRTASSACVP